VIQNDTRQTIILVSGYRYYFICWFYSPVYGGGGLMKVSPHGIEMIKRFEGSRNKAYQDSVGIWTIGVGHTGSKVHEGLIISDDEVDQLLMHDLEWVEKCISRNVTVTLTQNQFDALASFIFNLGCGAFKKSTLLKKLNAGDINGAAKEFLKWTHAGGKVLAGLVHRREKESQEFLV
jgi:lysozyme